MRDRLRGSDRQFRSPHSTLYGEKRRDGQDDSVVMTRILSVCLGGAFKDN